MKRTAIEKIQHLLEERNIDALIIHGKKNKQYCGALIGSGVYLLISKENVWQILDGRYIAEANQKTSETEIVVCQKNEYIPSIFNILKEKHYTTIALDATDLSISDYLTISNERQVELWKEELLRIRMRKDPFEIKKIEQACALSDMIFEQLMSKVHCGMTELAISAEIHSLAFRLGAEQMAFDLIVTSGKRGAYSHGRPTRNPITSGELVTIDFGIELDGYQSDCTRMFAVGNISEELKEIYDTVLLAQRASVKAVKAGIFASKVDEVARTIIDSSKFQGYFTHGLGHGMGLGGDFPILSPQSKDVLEENMVMTCEPGIYIEGVGGARIEDVVVVKDGIGKRLTLFPKKLFVIR